MPPSAVSNRPRFCCRASVNAPRSWPNSSLSSSCSGSAEQVMLTNARPRAVAVVVDRLGGQVLAGAGLAGQQHGGGRARGHARQQRLDLLHRRETADDRVEAVLLPLAAAQRPHFAPQLAGLERLLDEQRHFVEVERLVDVVVRAELHRLDGVLDRREGGHQDDQRLGRLLLDSAQHGQAVAVGQLEVEQHQIDALATLLERLGGRRRLEDGVALVASAARAATSAAALRRRRSGASRGARAQYIHGVSMPITVTDQLADLKRRARSRRHRRHHRRHAAASPTSTTSSARSPGIRARS